MTREELIDKICPLDATYNCNRGDYLSDCEECNITLNNLLDKYDVKVRADVIDDIEDKASWVQVGLGSYYKITSEDLEQLKEQK